MPPKVLTTYCCWWSKHICWVFYRGIDTLRGIRPLSLSTNLVKSFFWSRFWKYLLFWYYFFWFWVSCCE